MEALSHGLSFRYLLWFLPPPPRPPPPPLPADASLLSSSRSDMAALLLRPYGGGEREGERFELWLDWREEDNQRYIQQHYIYSVSEEENKLFSFVGGFPQVLHACFTAEGGLGGSFSDLSG